MTAAEIAALLALTPAELMTRVHALTVAVRDAVAAINALDAAVADLAAESRTATSIANSSLQSRTPPARAWPTRRWSTWRP